MRSRSSRLARGWLVGSAATLVAAISHDLAGGEFPGWLALLVGTVFAGTAGTLLIGRRRSLPRLLAVIAVGQAAFHLGFSQLGAPVPIAASHLHGSSSAWADPAAGHAAHLLTPGMLAAHLLAGLLTVALLRAAEGAVLRMLAKRARLLVRRLAAVTVPMPTARASRAAVDVVVVATPASRLVASLPRRGPPVRSFA